MNWKSILTTLLGIIGSALATFGVISEETASTLVGAIITIVSFVVDTFFNKESEEVAEKVVRKIEPMLKTTAK